MEDEKFVRGVEYAHKHAKELMLLYSQIFTLRELCDPEFKNIIAKDKISNTAYYTLISFLYLDSESDPEIIETKLSSIEHIIETENEGYTLFHDGILNVIIKLEIEHAKRMKDERKRIRGGG